MDEVEIDVDAMSGQITQFRRYACVGLAILAGAPTSSLIKVASEIYDYAHSGEIGSKSKPNLKQVK